MKHGGASGKYSETQYENSIGRGAYTSGKIRLTKGDTVYAFIGGQEGWNGGGKGEASGGDATDFRLYASNPTDFNSLKTRIMVAAGGGGGMYNKVKEIISRGDAGSTIGYDAKCIDNKGIDNGGGFGGLQTVMK